MAVTKIKAIKSTLKLALDYITNPEKTDDAILISSFGVNPDSAYLEYKMTADMAAMMKDKDYSSQSKNLAYHMMQSFDKRDDLTPAEAHQMGKQFADQFLDGKYEYVLTTHVDKGHIHNHIIFNATSFVDFKKFDCHKNTFREIRSVSDQLCKDNDLYVIRAEQGKGMSYKEWAENAKGSSWKSKLKNTIDQTIASAKTFEDFIDQMGDAGYEFKEGKHIAFKAPGQERFTRSKILGEEYSEEKLRARVGIVTTKEKEKHSPRSIRAAVTWKDKLRSVIDLSIQKSKTTEEFLEQMHNAGYEVKDGKHIAFRAPEQERFTRGKSLGEMYSREGITSRINGSVRTVPKKLKGNIHQTVRMAFTLDRRVLYTARREKIADVKALANTLLVIRKENIQKPSDFATTISNLRNQSIDVKTKLDSLYNKINSFNQVAKYLATKERHQDIYDRYQTGKKDKVYNLYENEIRSYEFATNKLQELKIDPNVNVASVLRKVEEFQMQANVLKDQYRAVDNNVQKVKVAQKRIREILGKGQTQRGMDVQR